MNTDERIAQFEELCRDDAENDMAHFSLAGAYMQAGRHADAEKSYLRCLEINPAMSKAYQLAAKAMIEQGEKERAGDLLTRGFVIAHERGDVMPRDAMAGLLKDLGKPVPEMKTKEEAAPTDGFICQRTGKPGTRMAHAPFRGDLGKWFQDRISQQTFDEWIGLGTKIINELKLDLSRDDHDAVYDLAMRRYLGLDDATYEEMTGQPPAEAPVEYQETIQMILEKMGNLESFGGQLDQQVRG